MNFTLSGYQHLLKTGLANQFKFLAFNDPKRFELPRVCLLRHDIDVDLGAAVQLAELEASVGVRSTYFVLLRSPVYNLFSRANHRFVERILQLGHWIGLHYDGGFQPVQQTDLTTSIQEEASILSRLFGISIQAISFHQPSQDVLNEDLELPGLINSYSRKDLKDFHYISDSNKSWPTQTVDEVFLNSPFKLQILIHPMWWTREIGTLTTEQIWNESLLANWERCQEQLLATERAYGPARKLQLITYDCHSTLSN